MTFLLLFTICFACALIPKRKKALYSTLLLACTLPSSNAFSQIISYQGIYFYDGFTAAYTIRIFIEHLASRKKTNFRIQITTFATIILYLAFLILGLLYNEVDKYYLKDIRPLLNIFFFAFVYDLYRKTNEKLSEKQLNLIFIASGTASFVKLALLNTGVYGFQDEYYAANSFRYLDASAYFCTVYLIANYATTGTKSVLKSFALIISAATVLITNSRFLILSISVGLLSKNLNKPIKALYTTAFIITILVSFYLLSHELNATRVIENMTTDKIMEQLYNRFAPALEQIRQFSGIEYLVGLGAGTSFEIPWFAYRGLETTHSNIDSAYLTYLTKYGILGLVLLAGFVVSAVPKSNISTPIRLFLCSIFIVSATPYQPYCIGLIASFIWTEQNAQ